MALIHEGIGDVVFDPRGEFFGRGQSVVMVPNTPFEEDEIIAENYLRSSKFRASGFDGFMQDLVAIRRDRLVSISDGICKEVAAFTEFDLSCSGMRSIDLIVRRMPAERQLAFWGGMETLPL